MYLDLVMLLNFLVDYLLLLGTSRLSGFPANQKRLLLAAAVGAVYSGGCMLNGFRFLSGFHWRVISLILISVIAFGWDRSVWKRCCIFLLLSFALGGMAILVGSGSFMKTVVLAVLLYLLAYLAFDGGVGGDVFFPIEIDNGTNALRIIALRDTGNMLRDPISGEQVLVVEEKTAQRLTGLTREELMAPLETMTKKGIPGLRLIPYKTVEKNGAFMLGMRFPNVTVNGRRRSAIVAFAPNGLGGNSYQAIAGGNMI